MNKNMVKIVTLCALCFMLSTVILFAAEDNAGPVKRWWRNIIKSGKESKETKEDIKELPRNLKPDESAQDADKIREKILGQPKLTKEQMLEVINNNLEIYGDEVSSKISEITIGEDPEGNRIFLYKKPDGLPVELDTLDEETLNSIYRRVVNESNLIRQERLNRQLESIRQAQQATRIPQIPKPVVQPPRPPQIPRTYTPPPAPPQPPRDRR